MDTLSSSLAGSDPPMVRRTGLTVEGAYTLAGRWVPWLGGSAAGLCAMGLYLGLIAAPTDPHQGEHFRIAFIQLPAQWLSLLIYALMASAAAYGLLGGQRLAAIVASALAPTGALFAFLALWTGSLWGKPIWGSWWVWDPRLSSELLLLFLFLGFIALQEAIDDARRADRAAGLLALVGLVGLPLLYFSVSQWSQTYGTHAHNLALPRESGLAIKTGLSCMSVGLLSYAAAAALTRLRNEILQRERNSDWVAKKMGSGRELG